MPRVSHLGYMHLLTNAVYITISIPNPPDTTSSTYARELWLPCSLRNITAASDTPCEPIARSPAESRNGTLAHDGNTLRIVAGAVRRIGIHSLASGFVTVVTKTTVDGLVVHLISCCLHQAFSSLFGPPVDEVSVRAVCIAASKLDRCSAAPSAREDFAQVVADREAQLRHRFHARRTSLVVAGLACLVTGL